MEIIEHIKGFLSQEEANILFMLTESSTLWHKEVTSISTGEKVPLNRSMAYISNEQVDYEYNGLKFPGDIWYNFSQLDNLRHRLNLTFETKFNSVLLNLYKDGRDEIRWHSDKEEQLVGGVEKSIIYAINLGATRKFWFFNKETKEKFFYEVAHGDLLKMNSGCQEKFSHAILKEKEVTVPRISLTFREVK